MCITAHFDFITLVDSLGGLLHTFECGRYGEDRRFKITETLALERQRDRNSLDKMLYVIKSDISNIFRNFDLYLISKIYLTSANYSELLSE